MSKNTLSSHYSTLSHFCQVLLCRASATSTIAAAVIITIVAIIAATTAPIQPAYAMSTTTLINSCDQIRENLKSVRVQDAKVRTYLGSRYDTILNNYMKPLNTRLISNNIALTDAKTQAFFSDAKSIFVTDYIDYQRSFEDLLAIDCKTDADKFLKNLNLVREKRKRLAQDVIKLNALVSDHTLFVKQIRDSL